MVNFFVIGIGAALGAWLRWGFGMLLNPLFVAIPLGTLLANLLGAFLMGNALFAIQAWPTLPTAIKLMVTTGFLGGLTTFSTFSAEGFLLLQREEWMWTAVLIFAHVGGSLLMTLLGYLVMRMGFG